MKLLLWQLVTDLLIQLKVADKVLKNLTGGYSFKYLFSYIQLQADLRAH